MLKLNTPHIRLRLNLTEGLAILRSLGHDIEEERDEEHCFRVETPSFRIAIYPSEQHEVGSVWYDDPVGRDSDEGIERKVQAYLQRYGAIEDWEMRMDNGWMRYWFNPKAEAMMVYGLHMDVIRFNWWSPPPSGD